MAGKQLHIQTVACTKWSRHTHTHRVTEVLDTQTTDSDFHRLAKSSKKQAIYHTMPPSSTARFETLFGHKLVEADFGHKHFEGHSSYEPISVKYSFPLKLAITKARPIQIFTVKNTRVV